MRRLFVVILTAVSAAILPTPPVGAQAAPQVPDLGFVDPITCVWDLGRGEPFCYGVPGDIPFLGDWNGANNPHQSTEGGTCAVRYV